MENNNEAQVGKNMIECKTCGHLIAKNAKKCPNCGAKNKKPVYKRVWFVILCIIVVIIVIACVAGGGGDSSIPADTGENSTATTEESVEYEACDVGTLNDALEENAVNAKDEYCDKYVELTGEISNIDSDGSYFNLSDPNDEWDLIGVYCYINDDSQLSKLKEYSKGDTITVKGKITDVGEVMGYSLDIDMIK